MTAGKNCCFIHGYKAVVMQRIADLVRTGHIHHVSGTVPREKVLSLYDKFTRLYETERSDSQASRARKAGLATFRLFLLGRPTDETIGWWLLRTDGKMPGEASREKWKDATNKSDRDNQRLQIEGYVLIRESRPGSKAPAWTWRYTQEQYQELEYRIVDSVRHHRSHDLEQTLHTISKTMGFAPARKQVKQLYALMVKEWRTKHTTTEPPPETQRIGYLNRKSDMGWYATDKQPRQRMCHKIP